MKLPLLTLLSLVPFLAIAAPLTGDVAARDARPPTKPTYATVKPRAPVATAAVAVEARDAEPEPLPPRNCYWTFPYIDDENATGAKRRKRVLECDERGEGGEGGLGFEHIGNTEPGWSSPSPVTGDAPP